MLGEQGYDVVGQAGDGARAIELAEELRPDLVILDVKMPVLDGIAAAERIAGQRLAPVVMLTAFSQRELVERARDAGAMAYLVKPFSPSDLVPAIEMAVSRFTELLALERRSPGCRPARGPQGRRPGQVRPAGRAGAQRARGVPVDPEDRHGPAALDARGRRGRRHPRGRPDRTAVLKELRQVPRVAHVLVTNGTRHRWLTGSCSNPRARRDSFWPSSGRRQSGDD